MRREQVPWDGGYHLLFEHPRLMKDLLRGFMPREVLAEVDVEGMEREKTDFYTDGFQKRDGDMLLKLPRRWGGEAYLWFLLEFQVQPERFMALRVCTYISLLYEHLVKTRSLGSGDDLPPVFAMVFYHGQRHWKAPTGLDGLIGLPQGSLLWPWQLQSKFFLLQEQAVDAGEVAGGQNLARALIRLNQCRTSQDFARVIEEISRAAAGDGDRELRRLLVEWIRTVLTRKHKVELSLREIEPLLEGKPMGLEHNIDAIIEDFKRVGREEGFEKGLLSGREEGRSVALLTVLEARFGASPSWGAVLKDLEGSGSMGEALRLASTAADGQAFEAALQELLKKDG